MKRFAVLFFALLPALLMAQGGPQVYNLSFDEWTKSGGVWRPYSKDAPASKRIWDSPNSGMSKLGINATMPEYEHVAVPGEGKAAAKVESRKVAIAFVAGSLYTGRYLGLSGLSGARTELGTPFKSRPRSLSGWYHYIPKSINYTKDATAGLKGKQDKGLIEVLLMDWDEKHVQDTAADGPLDGATDPHVVGRAVLYIDKATDGYVHFEVPFKYRSGKTPKFVTVTVTPSRYGSDLTGGNGSVIYVDEFQFNY